VTPPQAPGMVPECEEAYRQCLSEAVSYPGECLATTILVRTAIGAALGFGLAGLPGAALVGFVSALQGTASAMIFCDRTDADKINECNQARTTCIAKRNVS